MKYIFSLDESDYVTHYLFVVSTSKPSISRRRRGWAITVGTFFLLALVLYQDADKVLSYSFFGASIICLLFYPLYTRWRYKNHYKKQVNEHFSKSFGKQTTLEFKEDQFLMKDELGSESKMNYEMIASMHELPSHFILRLNNAQSLILPKDDIPEVEQLRSELVDLAKKLSLQLTDHSDWEWK